MSTVDELKQSIHSLERKNKDFEQRLSSLEKRLDMQYTEEPKETPSPKKAYAWEADIGLKLFGKIGILALVLGIGFFIKYAIENNWIDHLTRIIIGVVIGLGLIIGGELVSKKEKYSLWGLTLAGGGFAITYFAVYAAYHFEEYKVAIGISQTTDIVLLSAVVLFAILFSVKDNSRVIASEAFFLGFTTSFLSTNFELLTLIYTLILTIGLTAVVTYKKWAPIGIGGLIATYLVYLFWYFDNSDKFLISTIFLITYFLAYTIQSFLLSSNTDKQIGFQNVAITLINSLFFYLLYYFRVRQSYPDYDGLFTLALGIFCLIAYYTASSLKRENLAVTNLYLSILFITLAIPIQLNDEWITIIWALETLVLTLLSFPLKMGSIRYASYAVGLATVAKTLLYDTTQLEEFSVSNLLGSTRLFSFLAAIIAFYFVSWYLTKNKNDLSKYERFVAIGYSLGGLVLTFTLIFLEMEEFWISVGWTMLAATVLFLGFYLNRKLLRLQGIILFGITIAKVFLYDTRALDTLYRTISFIVLGIILLLASFIYTKYKDRLKDIF